LLHRHHWLLDHPFAWVDWSPWHVTRVIHSVGLGVRIDHRSGSHLTSSSRPGHRRSVVSTVHGEGGVVACWLNRLGYDLLLWRIWHVCRDGLCSESWCVADVHFKLSLTVNSCLFYFYLSPNRKNWDRFETLIYV
jgi:hypothetical protein